MTHGLGNIAPSLSSAIYADEALSPAPHKTLVNIRTNPPALPALVEDIQMMRKRLDADLIHGTF